MNTTTQHVSGGRMPLAMDPAAALQPAFEQGPSTRSNSITDAVRNAKSKSISNTSPYVSLIPVSDADSNTTATAEFNAMIAIAATTADTVANAKPKFISNTSRSISVCDSESSAAAHAVVTATDAVDNVVRTPPSDKPAAKRRMRLQPLPPHKRLTMLELDRLTRLDRPGEWFGLPLPVMLGQLNNPPKFGALSPTRAFRAAGTTSSRVTFGPTPKNENENEMKITRNYK